MDGIEQPTRKEHRINGRKAREQRRRLKNSDPMPPMVRQLAVAARHAYDEADEGDDVEGFYFLTRDWPDAYEITPDGKMYVHDLANKESST
jgi:hypothetical protein